MPQAAHCEERQYQDHLDPPLTQRWLSNSIRESCPPGTVVESPAPFLFRVGRCALQLVANPAAPSRRETGSGWDPALAALLPLRSRGNDAWDIRPLSMPLGFGYRCRICKGKRPSRRIEVSTNPGLISERHPPGRANDP